MPSTLDGSQSLFPTGNDYAGTAWDVVSVNDAGEVITAARFNQMGHSLLALQKRTLWPLQSGVAGVLTHAASGAQRPRVLFKAYTVSISADVTVAAISLPAFSAAERAIFPMGVLDPSNNVVLCARRQGGDANDDRAYSCALGSPVADTTGASTWSVSICNHQHEVYGYGVKAGSYVISVMIHSIAV